MKKIVLLSLLFASATFINQATAQKKGKNGDKIDPLGIECDKIYVSSTLSGVIQFSDPVNLHIVFLLEKESGEIVEDLPIRSNGSQTTYKTKDIHGLELDFDLLIEFEILDEAASEIICVNKLEPCSRQIVIGQK